jgi:hypothetical protein
LFAIVAFGTGWIILGLIDMTSINIARYSENNLNGARSSQQWLVRLVLKGHGVPLPGSVIIARKKFQA